MGDLEQLAGFKLPRKNDELNELLYFVKCELSGPSRTEQIDEKTELQLENVDTNRPDTWSVEGIARALRGIRGIETGIKKYSLAKHAAVDIFVDHELLPIRPYISCVIAKKTKLTDEIIRGIINLQEKLDQSYGRRRKRSSIGFYDFDLIRSPLTYGLAEPDAIKFVPLDGERPMSLREILENHPKGLEYGYIIDSNKRLPILLDADRKILSFPPIINSNDLGKITPETRNILVEVTGTTQETVQNTLTILTTALADRNAKLHPARVHYNYRKSTVIQTPDLRERTTQITVEDVNRLMGITLKPTEIVKLLRKARYDVKNLSAQKLKVKVPCYRLDILHPVDIIEDISIVYGLNNLKPRWPTDVTAGGLTPIQEYADKIRLLMIGFGFQEIMTFQMTNPDKQFTKMNQSPTEYVEVANPKITTMTCLRSWLLPSLLEFLGNNTHVEYPQKIFEVGTCTVPQPTAPNRTQDKLKLACVSTHSHANFTEMKSNLQPLMTNLDLTFALQPAINQSFLEGRVGSILIGGKEVGIIGEIQPQILQNWKLEDPVAAFELELEQLFNTMSAPTQLERRQSRPPPREPTEQGVALR
ncbi:MAG TPA: phenylalanine--tRNA ligase subunit beta [Candidatus Bathyarchaeia archaeon]|nr:phenylalanine--tRNA ligase subunit beta [Candidatus Bathyarchaeia archaeon]